MTTLGKYRHLSRTSTADGHFVIIAIDHRENLRRKLAPIDDEQFVQFKQEIINVLLPESSAVLTDPAFGIGAGIVNDVIGGRSGLLAPIEITNYDLHPSQRDIQFIPSWSVAKIKRLGGDGVKLLLPYHPEADNAMDKQDIVERIVEECDFHDIPFFLEPIAYSPDPDKPLPNNELRQIVVEMAKVFSSMHVDILKMQFPIDATQSSDENEWRAACAELDAACAVPWALLSAGVDYATFAKQAQIACEAGASGVIVGRAVWAEAVTSQGAARDTFINTTAKKRMQELTAICRDHATSWKERVKLPQIEPAWYETYE